MGSKTNILYVIRQTCPLISSSYYQVFRPHWIARRQINWLFPLAAADL